MALSNCCSGQDIVEEINKKLDNNNGQIAVDEIIDSSGNRLMASNNGEVVGSSDIPFAQIKSGYYTGDGQSSRNINIGFTPKWVLIFPQTLSIGSSGQFDAHAQMGLAVTDNSHNTVAIVTNGFQVYYNNATKILDDKFTNSNGVTYNYIAGI